MGNLHLVTGHAGTPHVTAADHGSFNAAIFGEGNCVTNRGSRFAATVISNNSIRIADGDIVMSAELLKDEMKVSIFTMKKSVVNTI